MNATDDIILEREEMSPPSSLRIACLLPSATEICGKLGLAKHVVGVTHECDVLYTPNPYTRYDYSEISDALSLGAIRSLTTSEIDPHVIDQASIDSMVKDSLSEKVSLYTIRREEFELADPSLIITQELCRVCAPSMDDLGEVMSCGYNPDPDAARIVSLEPNSLLEVAETFVTVADACGVRNRGIELKNEYLSKMELLQSIVEKAGLVPPKVLMLEWIDPPFDGGHWVPEMITRAGCGDAMESNTVKSKQITWDDIYRADPDCVLVACCGFETERNVADARRAKAKLSKLRAFRERRVYACNGNRYFARPGPSLAEGCAIVARVAFDTEECKELRAEIEALDFTPREGIAWQRVEFEKDEPEVPDIENTVGPDFYTVHREACDDNRLFYDDPDTGFKVFTEVAHKKRGKCCGSGCRHCPYSHENVKDKAGRIQQPAFLHEEWEQDGVDHMFSLSKNKNKPIKVMFNSGGKDSFLTMRALARQAQKTPFSLILLTTFDSTSRIIAHQEFSIEHVLRQAEHLGISLVGVPVHRGTVETYVERVQRALALIEKRTGTFPSSMVFGDLHLDHIRGWRDTSLGNMGLKLEYPLWKVPYDTLLEDLESSGVVPVISAVTVDSVEVGTLFERQFFNAIPSNDGIQIDRFGENGEFHTAAQVWNVAREQALGI